MTRVRIIKRTELGGCVKFVIQQKFLWWWVDGVERHPVSHFRRCEFDTRAQAQRNLCYFDGSKPVEQVVETRE